MELDLKPIIDFLTQLVQAIQNPYFLIFFFSWIFGYALNQAFPDHRSWMIPSILAFVGGVAGFILLGTVTVQGRTIGVMSGMTMSLASVGMHQAWYQIFVKRINDSTNGSQKTDQQNSKPA